MTVTYQDLPQQLTEPAIVILADALMIEPGFTFILPGDDERRRALQAILGGMISTARRRGRVFAAIEDNRALGVGVWAAPGRYPPGVLDAILTIPYTMRLLTLGREKQRQLREFDHNVSKYFPDEPFWYLQALGVDPITQGKGIGSSLIRHMIRELGDEALYLETATPTNVGFYERFGFQVLDAAAQLTPDNGPTHWTMLRPKP